MPEIVDVSIPSSRVGADSKSSFQTCLRSRARTFTLNPLSRPVQDLLGRGVRRAPFQQALCQGGVLGQGTTHPIASDFSRRLCRLLLESVGGEPLGAAGRGQVVAV